MVPYICVLHLYYIFLPTTCLFHQWMRAKHYNKFWHIFQFCNAAIFYMNWWGGARAGRDVGGGGRCLVQSCIAEEGARNNRLGLPQSVQPSPPSCPLPPPNSRPVSAHPIRHPLRHFLSETYLLFSKNNYRHGKKGNRMVEGMSFSLRT